MITGINCSCVMYISDPHQQPSFCLKHENKIFGRNRPDYERFRTDEDRNI